MAKNFPNLIKQTNKQNMNLHIKLVNFKITARRSTPRHMIVNMVEVKNKNKILKTAR